MSIYIFKLHCSDLETFSEIKRPTLTSSMVTLAQLFQPFSRASNSLTYLEMVFLIQQPSSKVKHPFLIMSCPLISFLLQAQLFSSNSASDNPDQSFPPSPQELKSLQPSLSCTKRGAHNHLPLESLEPGAQNRSPQK